MRTQNVVRAARALKLDACPVAHLLLDCSQEARIMAVDQRVEIRSGSIVFDDSEQHISGASIKVVGIGGGGGNAINRMIEAGIQGVQFLVANTDLQSLKAS